MRAPRGVALWTVRSVNPDGARLGIRQNVRGIDLNRNFPRGWRTSPRGGRYYGGRRPLSQPESRAAARLIRRLQPRVTIWFHQPYGFVVEAPAADPRVWRRYARLAMMRTGSATETSGHGDEVAEPSLPPLRRLRGRAAGGPDLNGNCAPPRQGRARARALGQTRARRLTRAMEGRRRLTTGSTRRRAGLAARALLRPRLRPRAHAMHAADVGRPDLGRPGQGPPRARPPVVGVGRLLVDHERRRPRGRLGPHRDLQRNGRDAARRPGRPERVRWPRRSSSRWRTRPSGTARSGSS